MLVSRRDLTGEGGAAMRKADLEKRCKRFITSLDRITDRADRIDKRMRRKSDRRWGYEMLAVSAVTAWSDFVEDIFYMSVNRDSKALSKSLGLELPRNLTLPTCEALFTTNGFLDFRSVGELRGKARKFLGSSHPFADIPSATGQAIDRLTAARNFIVHGSRGARAAYRTKVLHASDLTNLVAPGRFLTASESGRTRLAAYLDALRSGAKAVYNALN
jgi:hypothetical protein